MIYSNILLNNKANFNYQCKNRKISPKNFHINFIGTKTI